MPVTAPAKGHGDTRKRVRLGLYMFTPIMGGAEMYFKNLLWRIDRTKYEVTLFIEPWQVFEEFLELSKCPEVRVRRIPVMEPGGHYSSPQAAQPGGSRGGGSVKDRLRSFLNRPTGFSRFLKMLGWTVRRYASLLPNFLLLYRAFQKDPVELLHIVSGGYPGPVSAQLAPVAAGLAGVPVSVMSICNTPFPIAFPVALERLLDRKVRAHLNCALAPTRNLGEQILERCGLTEAQLAIVPYGVLDPTQTFGMKLVDGLAGGRQISMTASFLPHKGHRFLVDVFSALRVTYPDIRLKLVGDGPELENVQNYVASKSLTDCISFPGRLPLEKTLQVIGESAIVVHPSELEGVPYVILHSMSLGKPVLATKVGGIEQTIVDGESGLLVAPGDPNALQAALDKLLGDPAFCRSLGENARARYEAKFTLEAMVRNHEQLYEERLGRS